MPTYEYECQKCQHKFDHFQGIAEEKLKKCPECGEKALKRMPGRGSGIKFVNSGFHATDYDQKNWK